MTGYFVPDASGATYVTVTPNRLVDSRIGTGLTSGLSANHAKTFKVTDQSLDATRNIPSDAIAVTGNLTVTGQTAPGYFALTPVATNNPTTSTLNFPLGDNRANGVTVPLSGTGTLSVTYVAAAGQHRPGRLRRDRLLRARRQRRDLRRRHAQSDRRLAHRDGPDLAPERQPCQDVQRHRPVGGRGEEHPSRRDRGHRQPDGHRPDRRRATSP